MARQDKIASKFNSWIKKVNDYKILSSGFEGQIIRVKVTTDMYGDESDISIISNDVITVALDLPDEIPLHRLRKDVTQKVASTENAYLFDIIPIRGYGRFNDDIEHDDYLIHKLYVDDRVEQATPYYFVLKVSEVLGSINIKHLTRLAFDCAPYNGGLPQKVQDIISTYIENEGEI